MIITLQVNSNVVDEGLIKREDDGVKIVKLIGQGSFDTFDRRKGKEKCSEEVHAAGYFKKYIKHCKRACSLE